MRKTRSWLGKSPFVTLSLAVTIYAISIILIDIAPFFIGMYVDALGLTLPQAGLVQTVDQAGGVLGAIVGYFLMPRIAWRTLVFLAATIAAIANALTATVDTFGLLIAVRFVSGFGVVLITTVTACMLARAASPDRAFGVGLALGMALSAVAIWLLDAIRVEFGLSVGLGSGAIWLSAGALLAMFLPGELAGRCDATADVPVKERIPNTIAMGRAALLALFLFGISVNVVYGFLERVGLGNGLESSGVANALALGYVLSVFGCLVPTVFGSVGGRMKWIALTTALFLASLTALYLARSVSIYTVAFGLYASAWNMGLAYYMSLVAANDPEERYTRMMYIATVAAQSIGPAIAAATLTGAPLSAVFVISPLPAVAAAVIVFVVSFRIDQVAQRQAMMAIKKQTRLSGDSL